MATTKFQFIMRSGPVPGKVFLLEKEEAFLGRDLGNDFSVSDPEISRRHAHFYTREGGVFVEDLGSTNGTFLNGERITSPQQLRKGDLITLGESVQLIFDRLEETTDPTSIRTQVHPAPVYTTPAPQPHFVPEVEKEDLEPWQYPQPVDELPVQREAPAYEPPIKKTPAKRGLPTGMIVLLVAIVVLVCVIAVTMYFMPASWWCALFFNTLPGCPVPF